MSKMLIYRFKKGSGTVAGTARRVLRTTVPDPFLNLIYRVNNLPCTPPWRQFLSVSGPEAVSMGPIGNDAVDVGVGSTRVGRVKFQICAMHSPSTLWKAGIPTEEFLSSGLEKHAGNP